MKSIRYAIGLVGLLLIVGAILFLYPYEETTLIPWGGLFRRGLGILF